MTIRASMQRIFRGRLPGAAVLAACAAGAFPASASADPADGPRVERKPLAVGALWEFGQLGRGIYKAGIGNEAEVWTRDWMDHFGAFLTREAVVDGRLTLTGGLGGVVQYRKPEVVMAGFYGSQKPQFFIGPTRAEAVYAVGDPEAPWLRLGTGMFPYKYNAQAADMGEYLFRSSPYPTITTTGGYVLVGGASAVLQGFKANLALGNLRADLFLTTETALAPLYDWSLSAVAAYTAFDGLLELGGGVSCKRLLEIDPERTARRTDQNGYFAHGGRWYSSNQDYYASGRDWYAAARDSAASRRAAALSAGQAARAEALRADSARYAASHARWSADADTVAALMALAPEDPARPRQRYYTSAGTLVMARASLDLKRLFGMEGSRLLGPEDLKLHGEAALLGVEDYPVFYERRSDRLPIMVGLNLPGFGLLDLVAVQAEHFRSPWLNNTSQVGAGAINVPHFPIPGDPELSRREYNDLARRDDWKWSVHLRKRLAYGVTLSAQAANDHLRLVSSRFFYGPQFDHNEVTVSPDHWYWMAQVAWGI